MATPHEKRWCEIWCEIALRADLDLLPAATGTDVPLVDVAPGSGHPPARARAGRRRELNVAVA